MGKSLKLNDLLSLPVFSIIIGVFPLVFLWSENRLQIHPQAALLPFLLTFPFVLLIFFASSFLFKSFEKGNLFATIFFILFFTYGHVYGMIKGKEIFPFEFGFLKLLLVYLVLLILGILLVRKTSYVPTYITGFLNVFSLFLLLLNLAQVVAHSVSLNHLASPPPPQETSPVQSSNEDLPDIYYIILDSYASQDVLQRYFSFDNSEFISQLEARGFYVANCANSNFDGTNESVASSLNYSLLYIDPDQNQSGYSISDNAIRKTLAMNGYKFVTTAGFSAFNDIKDSDLYLNFVQDTNKQDEVRNSQFLSMYFQTTLVRVLFELYSSSQSTFSFLPEWFYLDSSFLGHAKFWFYQTKHVLDSLEKLPLDDENYLVYAHINSPHGPYVFTEQGEFDYHFEPEDERPYYLSALKYMNARILNLVDVLTSTSQTQPIIILQGDHSPHKITEGLDKHKILNAYYLPGNKDIPLYETITPVNTFRIILKYYFDQPLELLPDKIWVKNESTGQYEALDSQCE